MGTVANLAAAAAMAQPPVHYFQDSRLPLGAVAAGQLTRFQHLRGYVQPVQLTAPKGVRIAIVENGKFSPSKPAPLKVGLLIGQVYRLRVEGIPLREGAEVFPSIELINRLHPPEGQRVRFPVPIDFTQEELEYALDGNYVTRVIYLENPDTAYPAVDLPREQRVLDIGQRQDPLKAADKLGRPMAIVRFGSRVPQLDDPHTAAFLFDSPPVQRFPAEPPVENAQAFAPAPAGRRGLEAPLMGHYPRQQPPFIPNGLPRQPNPGLRPGSSAPLLGQPPTMRVQR